MKAFQYLYKQRFRGFILLYLDLLPFDFHCFDHKIYSNGSPLSRWEKALKQKYI